MRLTSIDINNIEMAALVVKKGCLPIGIINQYEMTNFSTDVHDLIAFNQLPRLKSWVSSQSENLDPKYEKDIIPFDRVKYTRLYHRPPKIWGIGLNFPNHAKDLSEKSPEDIPASFMKAATTIIGPEDSIKIPEMSEKTTGEAELGMIIGKRGKNIDKDNWLDYVAGFVPVLDMTAEDILRKNPRYLTLSKNFETFLSFGPHLITPDEIKNIGKLTVSTVLNNKVEAENLVSNMTFSPRFLVEFHSKVMTLQPGDIILTGTPQAVVLNDGDRLECRITGFPALINPVIDLKKYKQ